MQTQIAYPFIPPGREFKYVPAGNLYMQQAELYARAHSLDLKQKVACLIVKDRWVVGAGANGSTYHETHGCERKRLNCKSGESYDLCEGCHPKNHAEPSAIRMALSAGNKDQLRGADVYMWGHWWCCEPCWGAMSDAGIRDVYLLEGSERLFNMTHPDYIFR
jgi:deoxycytidylate deaminase